MSGKQLRIIVFEDDPGLVTLFKRVLEHKGHDVHVFPDPTYCPAVHPDAGQCKVESRCADIVITDHVMPNLSGADLLLLQRMRGCKAMDENKAIITGTLINEDLMAAVLDLGCKLFKKPFKIAELLEWVEECGNRLRQAEPG